MPGRPGTARRLSASARGPRLRRHGRRDGRGAPRDPSSLELTFTASVQPSGPRNTATRSPSPRKRAVTVRALRSTSRLTRRRMPGSFDSDLRVAHGVGLPSGNEDSRAHRLRHIAIADEDHLPREITRGEHDGGDAHTHPDAQAPAPRGAERRAQEPIRTGSLGTARAIGSPAIAFCSCPALFIPRIEGTPPCRHDALRARAAADRAFSAEGDGAGPRAGAGVRPATYRATLGRWPRTRSRRCGGARGPRHSARRAGRRGSRRRTASTSATPDRAPDRRSSS